MLSVLQRFYELRSLLADANMILTDWQSRCKLAYPGRAAGHQSTRIVYPWLESEGARWKGKAWRDVEIRNRTRNDIEVIEAFYTKSTLPPRPRPLSGAEAVYLQAHIRRFLSAIPSQAPAGITFRRQTTKPVIKIIYVWNNLRLHEQSSTCLYRAFVGGPARH